MPGTRGRRLVGVVLLGVGMLLLVERIGDLNRLVDVVTIWWPVAVAAFALANLTTFLTTPSPIRWPVLASLALLGAAGLILLVTTGVLRPRLISYAFPITLIVAGVLIAIWEGSWVREHQTSVSVTAFLRRSILAITAKDVRYLRVRALLGDVQIDLSQSRLWPEVEMHATVWRGRIKLHCPADWSIQLKEPVGSAIDIRDPRSDDERLDLEREMKLFVYTMGSHGAVELSLAQ